MADYLSACATAIKRSVPDLSDDDVEEILSAMVRRERSMPNRRDDALRWVETAKARSAEEILKARIKARAARIDAMRRIEIDTRLATIRGKGEQAGVQALSDLVTTSERAGAGRALSTEARKLAARDEFRGAFLADVQGEGLLPVLRYLHKDPDGERALVREISRLSGDQNVKPTTDARTKTLAEIFVRHRERMRLAHNQAGAMIDALPGYVGRTSHDPRRMSRAGFDQWADDITPKLDLPRIFAERDVDPTDGAAVRDFLRKIYGNLVSGNHRVATHGHGDGFKGPANLARALSEDRVLHFKDADAWLDYNRAYGSGNVLATHIAGLEHGADALALMRQWGTNPQTGFEGAARRLSAKLRDAGDLAQSAAIERATKPGGKLWREWQVVSGAADIPGSTHWASIGAAIRALQAMKSLGGVLLSSVSDTPIAASVLRHEGVNYWTAMGRNVGALFEGVPKGVRAEVAANVGAGFNGMLGGIYHRMGHDSGANGQIARAADFFFKVNLQTWWTDSFERGTAFTLSRHLAHNLAKPWAGIDPTLRTGLARFGVTEADWTAAQGVNLLADGADRYFHPGLLRDAGNVEAAERIGAWFSTTIGAAVTRETAYTRSLVTQGLPPGTVMGETMRLMMQFKSFPITALTRHIGREAYRGGDVINVSNVAQLIAMTTLFGFVSMTLKDIAKGRNPREIEDGQDAIETVTAAFLQGGGAGIFGDFLFGEHNRFGGGFLSTAAGPTAGTISQFASLFARAREEAAAQAGDGGNLRGLAAEGLRFVTGNMPGQNLFYTKLAVDHLFIHSLQEALSPGYLRRMERRVERENNQTFWLRPGGGLGEGTIADVLR